MRWGEAEWFTATQDLLRRERGLCAVCNRSLGTEMARHHRVRRRDGGDRLANLLGLHTACHRRVHAKPEESRRNGWICSFAADPSRVPVLINGLWWLLDDGGNRTPTSRPDL